LSLNTDMSEHYEADEAYFQRLKLSDIHQAVVEACSEDVAEPVLKMKKKEAAAYAAAKVKGTNWLPEHVRTPVVEQIARPVLVAAE
ncbi:hypothetical protein V6575_22870, partial [Roseibium sp. H3510]